MNILIQVAVIIYMFLVFPVLLGLLWNKISKKEKVSCTEIFVNGYFLMLAFFMIIALPAVKVSMGVGELAKLWMIVAIVLSVVATILCWRDALEGIKSLKGFWKNSRAVTKIVAGVFVLLVLISIFFVKPHYEDYTISMADTALATNSMYGYHPYTGEAYAVIPTENAFSPIEMLYTVAAEITGLSPVFVIQFLLPCFLQMWFVSIYWRIGKLLFETDEQKNAVFIMFILILHSVPLYVQNQALAAGIFRNAWNGQTLLGCCILPGLFSCCLALEKKIWNDWTWQISEIIRWVVGFGVLFLSAQLVYVRGIYYSFIMTVLWGVVIIARKGYRRYGITSKNH